MNVNIVCITIKALGKKERVKRLMLTWGGLRWDFENEAVGSVGR